MSKPLNKYVVPSALVFGGMSLALLFGADFYECFRSGYAHQMVGENFNSILDYTISWLDASISFTSFYLPSRMAINHLKGKKLGYQDFENILDADL